MTSENRNTRLDELEQIVVALYDSYIGGFNSWETKITFDEYIKGIQLALEYPELADILMDDRKRRYARGSK